jgi:outer membrane protein TolC
MAEKDDATLSVEEEVTSVHMRAQSAEEQARLLERARTSQMSAEVSIERGLGVGVRLWIDLLNARQQRFTIERDLARVRYDRELAQARLRLLADLPIH